MSGLSIIVTALIVGGAASLLVALWFSYQEHRQRRQMSVYERQQYALKGTTSAQRHGRRRDPGDSDDTVYRSQFYSNPVIDSPSYSSSDCDSSSGDNGGGSDGCGCRGSD